MKNTIAQIPGLISDFSAPWQYSQTYNWKNTHKVLHIEQDEGSDVYYLREVFNMATGKAMPRADMRRISNTLSKHGVLVVVHPYPKKRKYHGK